MAMRKPTGGNEDMAAYYMGVADALRAIVGEFVDDIESTGGIRLIGGVWAPVAHPAWTDLATTYLHACKALGRAPVDYEYD